MRKMMIAAALAAAAFPAMAQDNEQNGLVNVNIGDITILENFLNDSELALLNNVGVPITVQAPIGVAANVCNVSAAVLARADAGDAECDAQSGSQALAQLVSRQVLSQAM